MQESYKWDFTWEKKRQGTVLQGEGNRSLQRFTGSRIEPLKGEDGSLAVNEVEKANLNDFFANIGTRLGQAKNNFPQRSDRIGCSVPSVKIRFGVN